ncbi:MAG: serine dehydratase subunit alpha family protein [Erysipelotrichaceae bacterium]|nr:serine dehydratase subunit alpha family protein [Erysipelotrichaceae bacterium]
MNETTAAMYTQILKEELIPAMGCTEPIALAYAGAILKEAMKELPDTVDVVVSGNIIKNVKSVIVPHTGGMRGIASAVVSGLVAGNPYKQLEVLSEVNENDILKMKDYLQNHTVNVRQSDTDRIFEIELIGKTENNTCAVTIHDYHTNVTEVKKNDTVLYQGTEVQAEEKTDRSVLNIADIIEYADTVNIEDVRETLDRQIAYNTAIAEEGLKGNYGACIGKILLSTDADNVKTRAKAYAAAGSDARMNGCELPVVINSGSGNQGLTASLPVFVYAKHLQASEEQLYRALLVSNLSTIHLKTGIGCLSAYCGATSAGCGAAAGITYLYGGKFEEIAHTIVNAVAINSGVVCDGAKASCAAKIASSVEAGILGMQMYMHGSQFYGGDGIVQKNIENTIRNVADLARNGMKETDKEILRIMLHC